MQFSPSNGKAKKYKTLEETVVEPGVWLLPCPAETRQHWGGGIVGGISQNRNVSFSTVPKQPKLVTGKGGDWTPI